MKNAQMRSPSLRKKNSTTSIRRRPATNSVARETPLRAVCPNSALVRKSTIELRASSTCCSSIGNGSVCTQPSRSSKPSVAAVESSSHWLRTANTMPVMMPPSTTMPPRSVTHAARIGASPMRRSQPTSGLAAAARMSAMSTGMTRSLTCTSAQTATAPSTSTSRTWRLRMAQRPSRSFQIGPPAPRRAVSPSDAAGSPGRPGRLGRRGGRGRPSGVRVGRSCDDLRAGAARAPRLDAERRAWRRAESNSRTNRASTSSTQAGTSALAGPCRTLVEERGALARREVELERARAVRGRASARTRPPGRPRPRCRSRRTRRPPRARRRSGRAS